MKKIKREHDLIQLLDHFIHQTEKGRRLQKNGKKIRSSSIEPYLWLRKLLLDFSEQKKFPLKLTSVDRLKKRELAVEKKYWKEFYLKFTDYLYNDLDCFDNYVGSNIKRLRALFNYLNEEKELSIGNFHRSFYCYQEEIEIITLLPERLNFLIYNKGFEASLPAHLRRTKDIFVFGCTVALRVSDIFRLSWKNVEELNGKLYLNTSSQKTNTRTRILLPDYAVAILRRYPPGKKSIFPSISVDRFNNNIKQLTEMAGWTEEKIRTRQKRGIPIPVYKNPSTKESFRFCDLLSSHTMRRTAITTMLCLHMPENLVRKISGHAPGSKEFFRYVHLSQQYMDTESELVFEQLKTKSLHI